MVLSLGEGWQDSVRKLIGDSVKVKQNFPPQYFQIDPDGDGLRLGLKFGSVPSGQLRRKVNITLEPDITLVQFSSDQQVPGSFYESLLVRPKQGEVVLCRLFYLPSYQDFLDAGLTYNSLGDVGEVNFRPLSVNDPAKIETPLDQPSDQHVVECTDPFMGGLRRKSLSFYFVPRADSHYASTVLKITSGGVTEEAITVFPYLELEFPTQATPESILALLKAMVNKAVGVDVCK